MKTIKILAAAMAVCVATGFANCTKSATATTDATAEPATEEATPTTADMDEASNILTPANDSIFRPGMTVTEPTLIDFNATWCGPCRMLAPAFDLAAANYAGKVKFYSIDTDKYPETAKAFDVRSIPNLLLILPDGSTQNFVGTTEFVKGLDETKEPTQEELTNVMYGNLSKILDAALSK